MAGVVFVVCIPSANFEHVLTYGKSKPIQNPYELDEKQLNQSNIKLELESRSENSSEIPVHFTQCYRNDTFIRNESNDGSEREFIPMEKILQELLTRLEIEYAAWNSDTTGNYLEVIFPVQTGVPCENMLHCLTQLGIGKKLKSIINVLPCSVVHSSLHASETENETYLRSDEEKKRWKSFVNSIRSKLTVKQVVDGVRSGGEMSFDYIALIVTADSLAALGLIENNSSNIVAAMLVSPLMGPVMSVTFGAIVADKELIRTGFFSLFIGMIASCVFGFIFGLIVGSTEMPWGFGDWPTEEMKSRGNVRSLWMGVLWALTSGTGVAIALLQGSAGPLIGVAISASLLPPVVNCGLFWALACIWLLHKDTKIPHIAGEKYYGNSSYEPIYHDYIPIEFAINGLVSACLTIVNVICIFITAIILLKIKEVAAPYTSSPDLRRFWRQDLRVVREENRNNMKAAEESERREYMMQELPNLSSEGMEDKLIAAINEAVDDDTFRKVQRMSYQSHTTNENIGKKIGLLSSKQSSKSSTPYSSYVSPRSNTYDEIAALDKLLSLLLQIQPKESLPLQHLPAHSRIARSRHNSTLSTASSSVLPTIVEDVNYRQKSSENNFNSWSERAHDNSVVQTVLNNLHSEPGPRDEEPFLAGKNNNHSN